MPADLQDFRGRFPHIETDAQFCTLSFDLRSPQPKTLTFAGNIGFLTKAMAEPNVSAIITTPQLLEAARARGAVSEKMGFVLVENPRQEFLLFHNALSTHADFYVKRQGFQCGENSKIHPASTVSRDGVHIGKNVCIEAGVVIKPNVHIGDDCVIRAGTVLGGKGFQYLRGVDGTPIAIAHVGGVHIGNRVEIHGGCAIDRHIFDHDTIVGDDTKFDNHVQFAHGSCIGKRCLVAAAATISGSVRIGDDVWIGPNSTICDSLTIGDKAAISLGSVVVRDVPGGMRVTGNFAEPHLQFLKRQRIGSATS